MMTSAFCFSIFTASERSRLYSEKVYKKVGDLSIFLPPDFSGGKNHFFLRSFSPSDGFFSRCAFHSSNSRLPSSDSKKARISGSISSTMACRTYFGTSHSAPTAILHFFRFSTLRRDDRFIASSAGSFFSSAGEGERGRGDRACGCQNDPKPGAAVVAGLRRRGAAACREEGEPR